jgi:hypothetical protein
VKAMALAIERIPRIVGRSGLLPDGLALEPLQETAGKEPMAARVVESATYMDWYELKLWLWAFLEDAQALLDASQQRNAINLIPPNTRPRPWAERLTADARFDLNKYHLVMTMGL